jgi:hypothetical protein
MKYSSSSSTVIVNRRTAEFVFKYWTGFVASIRITVEATKPANRLFDTQRETPEVYTGSVFVFANGVSADQYLHYTMSSKAAGDLLGLLCSDAPASRVAAVVAAQSDDYVHRDSGMPKCESRNWVEDSVWAAFSANSSASDNTKLEISTDSR